MSDNLAHIISQTGIMGFTKSGAPFVSAARRNLKFFIQREKLTICRQVGPIIDPSTKEPLQGQYIAAGYTGHGMPRAFAWCVQRVP